VAVAQVNQAKVMMEAMVLALLHQLMALEVAVDTALMVTTEQEPRAEMVASARLV
jgi:hypothetical protein